MGRFLLLFIILATLFISSGQTYENQSLIGTLENWLPNKPFEQALSQLQIPYWGTVISVEERGYFHFVEFLIRKSAHFIIFGFLAIAIYMVLPPHKFRTLFAALFTFLFAAGDEFHQLLTGGRTATMQDVILDMSGAITFLIIFKLVLSFKSGKRLKSSKS